MESLLNSWVDAVLSVAGLLFTHRWAAPILLTPLMMAGAGYLWWRAQRRVRPFLNAAAARIEVLQRAIGTERDPIAERASFATHFGDVAAAMAESQRGAESLSRAWQEFHETVVDETETPIRNTARPSVYFGRSAPRLDDLNFWSNAFVGIGLLLTFLGIVVALNETAKGMAGDATVEQTKDALKGLLTIASAKFFTSIAGVGCSILLRFAETGMHRKLDERISRISDLLEAGLLYVPAQLLAVKQLDELERQSKQLEKFNTDLAVQIGEQIGAQFQSVITPIASSLSLLNDNIDGMSSRLGEGVGKAVEGAASGELRALGQTLAALREQLENLSGHVEGSGEEAARQIRAAGEDFARASSDIRGAFDSLTGQVEGLGRRLTEESDTNSQRQRDLMDSAVTAFRSANEEAARGLRDSLEALQGAGATAAADLRSRVGQAMAQAAEEADAALRRAIQDTSEGFARAGGSLIVSVTRASVEMNAAADAMHRAEQGTAANADNLRDTSDSVRAVNRSLNEAAQSFSTAAAPVAEISRSFRDASERIAASLDRSADAGAAALKEMSDLAAGVRETQEAAAEAWADYRARFADVDQALERTLQQMATTLSTTLSDFRKFGQDMDVQMGEAISRLAPVIERMKDNTDEIADFAEALRASAKPLAPVA
ncbi:MAG TPA: anti-phage ZorAB system protein ZorA [Caulobacteraceae bacterium]